MTSLLEDLGLEQTEVPNLRHLQYDVRRNDEQNSQVGVVYYMTATMGKRTTSVQAQCKAHGSKCKCWINVCSDTMAVEVHRDLLIWLADAKRNDPVGHAEGAAALQSCHTFDRAVKRRWLSILFHLILPSAMSGLRVVGCRRH